VAGAGVWFNGQPLAPVFRTSPANRQHLRLAVKRSAISNLAVAGFSSSKFDPSLYAEGVSAQSLGSPRSGAPQGPTIGTPYPEGVPATSNRRFSRLEPLWGTNDLASITWGARLRRDPRLWAETPLA